MRIEEGGGVDEKGKESLALHLMSGNLSLASANVPSHTTPKGYGGMKR